MIVETLTGLGFLLIEALFEGLQVISLPTNFLAVLVDFMRVGAWILGADLLSICFTSILSLLTFKLTAGLIVFIWRLLPLT